MSLMTQREKSQSLSLYFVSRPTHLALAPISSRVCVPSESSSVALFRRKKGNYGKNSSSGLCVRMRQLLSCQI